MFSFDIVVFKKLCPKNILIEKGIRNKV